MTRIKIQVNQKRKGNIKESNTFVSNRAKKLSLAAIFLENSTQNYPLDVIESVFLLKKKQFSFVQCFGRLVHLGNASYIVYNGTVPTSQEAIQTNRLSSPNFHLFY